MGRRIGGEMEITLRDFLAPVAAKNRPTFHKKKQYWLDTGRSAIYLAAKTAKKRLGSAQAWLPRYCCDSVVRPFEELGYRVKFYSMGAGLQAPPSLPDKLSGVFLFIHYFGKRNEAVERHIISRQKERSKFIVIEDCVQATLTSGLGRLGDFCIYGYRKFLPVPDGAVLACDFSVQDPIGEPDEAFIAQKFIGKVLRGNGGSEKEFLALLRDSEQALESPCHPRVMSWLSRYLLKRTDLHTISKARRGNWSFLYSKLQEIPGNSLKPFFSSLREGEVPLGFPVRVTPEHRDKLRAFLMTKHIFCPVHWDLPAVKGSGEFAEDGRLSRSILTLPIDQRLSEPDIDAMVGEIRTYFGGAS